ncbi:bifunctional diaminohydroxyphosphoribosylaminopyrimidine deaminase/5-amino-6-(5-phosphoribosylamino)uracil reductase RibD [Seonamhaeicola maritimus]|uniref:Riboflavin biosynthesis protein RibD n=1 Tax=Seonamhaeicola maritimus TaxID=2591822 RepID=A0A5C7GM17_9FLAO|nr:bifunctional diaminohydroxyphosphoribosylaminopyrimidine deaminase/5-amino-6-(5-phosphoribosylamino)uracil reductase RibD [Seonamhaeicola maritimus]TXG39372.1 bifunctional diaminohydroxyphosphoribosylaminopyrimidine deaminase/5-amino-6-(5-phosphoribosylamino)uracil reductase RibD [Seonamhaeicola maritimus]
MSNHEIYIKRCIEIAKNGLGKTSPNPMVGAVIVCNNSIIGEGFTSAYGGNHAEVNAINSVTDKELLKEATLYVTLEPCSHFGKTPPCSDLIIKNEIPNVVIGCVDDNEQVAGKGIKKLIEARIKVTVGILENECKQHHKRFFTFHNKKRPYIILKWAETDNGFIAPETKNEQKPVWITNKYSRQLVHKWRTEEQAILVGTNTVLQDNPSLTVRDWTGKNPTRIVIDENNTLSKGFNIFNDEAETIVISNKNIDFSKNIAQQICNVLFKNDINSIIIEGGAKTLQTFINANLWEEARVFTGNLNFKNGTKAPSFRGKMILEENINGNILKTYLND